MSDKHSANSAEIPPDTFLTPEETLKRSLFYDHYQNIIGQERIQQIDSYFKHLLDRLPQ